MLSRLNVECRFLRRGENRKNGRRNTSWSKGESHSHIASTPGFEARATVLGGDCSHHCVTPCFPGRFFLCCRIDILCWCLLKVNLLNGRFHFSSFSFMKRKSSKKKKKTYRSNALFFSLLFKVSTTYFVVLLSSSLLLLLLLFSLWYVNVTSWLKACRLYVPGQ